MQTTSSGLNARQDFSLKAISIESVFDTVYVIACLCIVFLLPSIASKMAIAHEKPHQKPLFPRSMPALASMRYIAILCLWIQHEWMYIFQTSMFFLLLSGFVLQFAEERRSQANDDKGTNYFGFIHRRLEKIYPLYALHVIVGYLGHFKDGCDPILNLAVLPNLMPYSEPQTCGIS